MTNKKQVTKKEKEIYLSLLPAIRDIAKKCGYAIGVHGSLTRDFDLIAVPWVDKCLTEKTLVRRIIKAISGYYVKSNTEKPHGRKAHTILLIKHPARNLFIDLSITPQKND